MGISKIHDVPFVGIRNVLEDHISGFEICLAGTIFNFFTDHLIMSLIGGDGTRINKNKQEKYQPTCLQLISNS